MPNHNIALRDFTISTHCDQDVVIEVLRKFGGAVLSEYIQSQELDAIKAEFQSLSDDDAEYVYKINYEPGRALSLINNNNFRNRYPSISGFFNNSKLLDLAHQYVGCPCLPNYEIYATHEYIPDATVAPTHFDKLWTLKFMLYLEDVGPGNAPFGVVPGSAKRSRAKFRDIFEKNRIHTLAMSDDHYQKMENSAPELDKEVVDIIGPAGTLIIFDSDTYHHASPVATGCERKVLRGHSGPYVEYPYVKKYSRQWWRGEKAYSRFDELKDKFLLRG